MFERDYNGFTFTNLIISLLLHILIIIAAVIKFGLINYFNKQLI